MAHKIKKDQLSDPVEVADMVIDLVKRHGWSVSVNGIEILRVRNGNIETYTIQSGSAEPRLQNITLPNRPYKINQVGRVTEITSE